MIASQDSDVIAVSISMSILHFVAKKIGRDWLGLSVALRVENETLDNIKETCSNLHHRALALLYDWHQRNEDYATKEVLMKALRDSRRNDIADTIQGMEWHIFWSHFRCYLQANGTPDLMLAEVHNHHCIHTHCTAYMSISLLHIEIEGSIVISEMCFQVDCQCFLNALYAWKLVNSLTFRKFEMCSIWFYIRKPIYTPQPFIMPKACDFLKCETRFRSHIVWAFIYQLNKIRLKKDNA